MDVCFVLICVSPEVCTPYLLGVYVYGEEHVCLRSVALLTWCACVGCIMFVSLGISTVGQGVCVCVDGGEGLCQIVHIVYTAPLMVCVHVYVHVLVSLCVSHVLSSSV